MEIDRDWGPWTGSLLKGSLANSLMKTAGESRSRKLDKNGWYRVSTLRVGVLACVFLFAIRNCHIRKEYHGFTNTITRVENLNAG